MKRSAEYLAIPIVLAFVFFVIYCTAYAFTGHRVGAFRDPTSGQTYCGTSYGHTWQAKFFIPAAWLESVVRRQNTATGTVDEATWLSSTR
jgi:hypothetical protein